MTGIRARIDRIEAAVRQARERGMERIREVIVHLPAGPGDPIGEKVLIHAGIGQQPSIFHQYDGIREESELEEAGGA